jgi:hypothetical protein
MLVSDVIDRINFAISSQHTLQGKDINNIFSNKNITQQLKFALDRYAIFTKALEEYYSLPVAGNTGSILLPNNIIRSEGVRFIEWFINGYGYPLNIVNLNNTWGNFPVPVQGLPKWANIWKDRINFYPQNSNGFNHTTLTADITSTTTTIPVVSTAGFQPKNGRMTIGTEIIQYSYKDATNFYGCSRAQESTTAAPAANGTTVNENNVWVYYYRLHFPIPVNSDDTISQSTLDLTMLIPDDHMEVICDYTAFKLLSKIDITRANFYKVNWEEWLVQARKEIIKGRSIISKTTNIRDPYMFESQTPYYPM